MDRRQMLGVVGAGAAGLAVMSGRTAEAQQGGRAGDRTATNLDQKKLQDLQMMQECIHICNETAQHCMTQARQKQGNVQDHLQNHEHVMDCVQVCGVTADFMARKSPFSQAMHKANAEVCRKCADVCENSQDDAEILKTCAESCRKCAEMCSRYAQGGHNQDERRPGEQPRRR